MALTRFADTDIEELLTDRRAVEPELVGLAAVLTQFREANISEPSLREVDALARRAAAITRSQTGVAFQSAPRRRLQVWLRSVKVQSASAIALFVLVCFSGLGLAANAAVPGDLLYGLDMMMERVGIGAGALEERISEAQVLAGRGQDAAASEHLKSAIAEYLGDTATDVLPPAIDNVDIDVANNPDTGPTNPNAGPGNNSANNPDTGPTNPNAGPGNNSANNPDTGPTNPNAGPGNNSAGGNGQGNGE